MINKPKKTNLTNNALLVTLCFATILTQSKTIRIFNDTGDELEVGLAHFSSSAYVDRSPTKSVMNIQPEGYSDLYIKPYHYAGHIYIPNRDWALDAGPKGSEAYNQRTNEIEKYYSFNEGGDFWSMKVESGSREYVFISAGDEEIGQLLKELPESPEGNDGIHISRSEGQTKPVVIVMVNGKERTEYEDEEK